ncbi:hypothetical protein P4O66_002054 [Electrophorus voltai]|uniref:Reverse transcriptase domain-containing protein n=1 Tax=Electrophorus voltai TaxID=2609070 RepID=A0AAD8Z424_9TELE|nr:hypothetical protein P4O66_002054 [Electrophorus voltai]
MANAHNPHLQWTENRILKWAATCEGQYLPLWTVSLQSMSIKSPESGSELTVPQEYSNLAQVFSPSKATQLLPHHDWDCSITLKEGTVPPRCRVYPLSQEEERTMGQYIKEALQQDYIRPSTSLASTSVSFVKKKDGGLRPCVDYRALNELLVQYPYPLPLVPTVLEQLREAQLFTKLDLRSAYNLIRIMEDQERKTRGRTPGNTTPGTRSFTHLFPGHAEMGPRPKDKGSESTPALPTKLSLCSTLSPVEPLSCGHTPPGDRPPRNNL